MNDIFIPLESISHLPVLKYILDNCYIKNVLEYGLGYGSTKLFLAHGCDVTSIESDPRWVRKFSHNIIHSRPVDYTISGRYDLIFIDCHPSKDRVVCLNKAFDHTSIIVAHDTEPPSEPEYGYSRAVLPPEWSWLDCKIKSCWTTVFTCDRKVLQILENMPTFGDDEIIQICQIANGNKEKK